MVLRRLIRHFGYDLVKRGKQRDLNDQLVQALYHHRIDAVLDVGANRGQYGARLRAHGWTGPIVSFEPLPDMHAALLARARDDARWVVAPPMALGAKDATATIERSAESDMSSLLPQNATLKRISPSSAVQDALEVQLHRLDSLPQLMDGRFNRLFLKIDVQGFEPEVLEGAKGLLARIQGIQVETALVPLYVGERDFKASLDLLERLGFDLHLTIPGYFERKLARQLQLDLVAFREEVEAEATPAAA